MDERQQDDERVRPVTDRERIISNIVLLVIAAGLIGIWLTNGMLDARRADDCMSHGRRNCAPIDVPPR